jgi:hypothetical protein
MSRTNSRSHRGLPTVRGAALLAAAGVLGAGLACVEQEEEKPTEEDVAFIKQNLLSAAPKPMFATNADIDGKVKYLGLDSSMNPIEPGRDVKITHYWQVVENPGAGWRTFTHLNGAPNGAPYVNVDHGPMRGKYPVTSWKAGDIIKDEHVIRLPPTWPTDKVYVSTGLWKGAQRLPIKSGASDDAGRVTAAIIPVASKVPPPQPKRLIVKKADKPIKLDGKLDEAAWQSANSTGAFVNTLTGAAITPKTEAKLLWDKDNLYFAFQNEDADVWTTLGKRDDKLWQQEAVEIFIDADKNGKSYVEIQVAPNGNIFDTYLPEYRKYEDAADPKRKPYDWNSKTKAKVVVDGTFGKRDDQDKSWVAEIAIPLSDVNGLDTAGAKLPPQQGDVWRVNMFRLDSPEGKAQIAMGWSAPMVGDFHALDKFGEIVFGDEKGEIAAPTAAKPAPGGKEAVKTALEGVAGAAAEKKAVGAAKKAKAE